MKNKEVANAFLAKIIGSSLHMYSDGNKLFSYYTCIAQHTNMGIIGNATKYSSTTSKHLGFIRRYIDLWTTMDVPRGTRTLIDYL